MKEYTIDLSGAKSIWDIHYVIKTGLQLSDLYGMNMDALWDCLTSDIDDPCIIYLKGLEQTPEALCGEVDILLKILKRTKVWYENINSQVSFDIID